AGRMRFRDCGSRDALLPPRRRSRECRVRRQRWKRAKTLAGSRDFDLRAIETRVRHDPPSQGARNNDVKTMTNARASHRLAAFKKNPVSTRYQRGGKAPQL